MTVLLVTGACAVLLAVAAVPVARRLLAVIEVRGGSMLPNFAPGDRVLVLRGVPGPFRRPRPGSVIVMRMPTGSAPAGGRILMIKRVAACAGEPVPESARPRRGTASVVPPGTLAVSADNPAGTDSRQLGFIPAGHVVGRVIGRLGSASSRSGTQRYESEIGGAPGPVARPDPAIRGSRPGRFWFHGAHD